MKRGSRSASNGNDTREARAARIATVITGVLDVIDQGVLADEQRHTTEDAVALREYQAAMEALTHSDDEEALPFLWYAAYEKAQHLMYIRTRNVLNQRLSEVVAAKNRRKWS